MVDLLKFASETHFPAYHFHPMQLFVDWFSIRLEAVCQFSHVAPQRSSCTTFCEETFQDNSSHGTLLSIWSDYFMTDSFINLSHSESLTVTTSGKIKHCAIFYLNNNNNTRCLRTGIPLVKTATWHGGVTSHTSSCE